MDNMIFTSEVCGVVLIAPFDKISRPPCSTIRFIVFLSLFFRCFSPFSFYHRTFSLTTVIGMVTSRAVMKENALIDGLINAVTAIPPIAYLIVFIGAWGSGAKTTLVALTVSYILRYIKLVRTRTDMEMGKAYVMCAIASGASKLRIMLIHIFPNLIAEMIRFLCLSCADMILAITGFSFIGLGLGDNVVDWGSMILDARGALVLHPTMILYPIGAVILSTLCFNVIGRQLTTKEAE